MTEEQIAGELLEIVEDTRPDEILDELRQCRHKLGAIAGWVAFLGIVVLLSIGLSMCSAVMGMG